MHFRKIKLAFLFLLVVLLPIQLASAASAQVEQVRWVTRTDSAISYVRMVLDMTKPVKAEAVINSEGTTTTIKLKDAKLKNGPERLTMDPKIAGNAVIGQNKNDVILTIATPTPIDENAIKVFQLRKDVLNDKPYRMVIDVMQQNVVPRQDYYGSPTKTLPPAINATNTSPPPIDYKTTGGISGKVIVIDPGHGGSDPGAISQNGNVMEKNVTLPIAMALKKDLENMGAKVFMTRTTDVDVYGPNASGPDELQARVNVGNYNKADLFVSIHINSFTNPNVGGISAYYYNKSSYDRKIADTIDQQISSAAGFGGDRGVIADDLYVLRHTGMPATLLELGFISNPQEANLLTQSSVQEDFANRIAQGIKNYFQG